MNAGTTAKECKGYVTKHPAVSVNYQGKGDMLKVFFYSDGDPILIVQTPDGKVLCNDNTNHAGLRLVVVLHQPDADAIAVIFRASRRSAHRRCQASRILTRSQYL